VEGDCHYYFHFTGQRLQRIIVRKSFIHNQGEFNSNLDKTNKRRRKRRKGRRTWGTGERRKETFWFSRQEVQDVDLP
jgi:hypothetical protein